MELINTTWSSNSAARPTWHHINHHHHRPLAPPWPLDHRHRPVPGSTFHHPAARSGTIHHHLQRPAVWVHPTVRLRRRRLRPKPGLGTHHEFKAADRSGGVQLAASRGPGRVVAGPAMNPSRTWTSSSMALGLLSQRARGRWRAARRPGVLVTQVARKPAGTMVVQFLAMATEHKFQGASGTWTRASPVSRRQSDPSTVTLSGLNTVAVVVAGGAAARQ